MRSNTFSIRFHAFCPPKRFARHGFKLKTAVARCGGRTPKAFDVWTFWPMWTGFWQAPSVCPVKRSAKQERVKVPFSFRAPSKPGVHTLKLDLVQQNVTLFEDQGVEPMMVEFEVTGSGKDHTGEKTENARRISGLPNYGVVYVDHSIPRSVQAGTRFGARVSIENRGAMIWPSSPADHRSVDLAIFVNDRPVGTEKLPLPVVRLGGACYGALRCSRSRKPRAV